MKTMVYDNEVFQIVRQDQITVALRYHGVNRIQRLLVKETGEIEVISRCVPWLHDSLKSIARCNRGNKYES